MGKSLVIHNDNRIYVIEHQDKTYKIEKQLNLFATSIKTPERIHTYEIDEYSLWSAAALDIKSIDILEFLKINSNNQIPENVKSYINDTIKDFWTLNFSYKDDHIVLIESNNVKVMKIVKEKIKERNEKNKGKKIVIMKNKSLSFAVNMDESQILKDIMIKSNLFIKETVSNVSQIAIKVDCELYEYQKEAVEAFINGNGKDIVKRGLVTMPPGSGKTLVGLKIIETLKVRTLILVEKQDSFNIWRDEIYEKTNFNQSVKDTIECNKINDNITIVTYRNTQGQLFEKINQERWGLIIYDDAHKLPSPKNQRTAFIASPYKLALGSIIHRADNNQNLIYKAIGPKLYSSTIKELEARNIHIKVECMEIKLPQNYWEIKNSDEELHKEAKNIYKLESYKLIEGKHGDGNYVIGTYYQDVGEKFYNDINNAELAISDKLPQKEREEFLYHINSRNFYKLIASEIIEKLPLKNIDVSISISYKGSSNREEYLRIGKLKSSNIKTDETIDKIGYYYALVNINTKEEEKYRERRDNMISYGYKFKIRDYNDLLKGDF
ncbi:MAG: DEAD/DEAH box helicase family protein [Sedimentibacter sp.]